MKENIKIRWEIRILPKYIGDYEKIKIFNLCSNNFNSLEEAIDSKEKYELSSFGGYFKIFKVIEEEVL